MPQRMHGYTEFRGTPWPPAGAARGPAEPAAPGAQDVPPVEEAAPSAVPAVAAPALATTPEAAETAPAAPAVVPAPADAATPAPAAAEPGRRMAGYTAFRGTPWPPAAGGRTPVAPATAPAAAAPAAPVVTPSAAPAAAPAPAGAPSAPAAPAATAPAADRAEAGTPTPGRRMAGYTAFRGSVWPPAAAPVQPAPAAAQAVEVEEARVETPAVAEPAVQAEPAPAARADPGATPAAATEAPAPTVPAARTRQAPPAAATPSPAAPSRTAKPAKASRASAPSADAAGPSLRRRLGMAVGGAVLLGLLAVFGARWLIGLPAVADFVARYPGVPAHPEATPVGVPAWLAWQHFLNAFLMVLIIRTGLQVRGETRPPANFTPKKPGLFAPPGSTGKKFSLTIWIHQALDALWLLNGLVFVVLLAVTGHWRRLIPLDPATPQHMASTALQYATLDWPAHDGWLHYNALQMTAYAAVVFVLAPLAALTGFRMSSWWPAENAALSRAFPMELARRLHFPTMIAFVAFIVVHVALVLFSGVLENLNAMFLARHAADAWGLVAFLVAAAVTAAAWVLLKPAFISPVAERFGRVGR